MLVAGLAPGAPGSGAVARSHPLLGSDDIAGVRFGQAEAPAVAAPSRSPGPPNAAGVNTACGPSYTEVTWDDLAVESRRGRFSGYRLIRGGWPLTTPHSPRDRVASAAPTPALSTAAGITLRRPRSAYRPLRLTGAESWSAADGLTSVTSASDPRPGSSEDTIVEVELRACGAF